MPRFKMNQDMTYNPSLIVENNVFLTMPAEDEPVPIVDIVEYLDIGGVPYVLMCCHILAKFLNNIPVVIIIKLIAMSPQIEHLRIIEGVFYISKSFCHFPPPLHHKYNNIKTKLSNKNKTLQIIIISVWSAGGTKFR